MDHIDSIQAEINDEFLACLDEPWPEEEQASTSASADAGNIIQLNLSILTKALGGISEDDGLPEEMRNRALFFLKNAAAQSKLRTSLIFVDNCIHKKGVFTSVQRQTSLQNFFAKQVENMALITAIVKNKQTAAMISSCVFEQLLNANFESRHLSPHTCTEVIISEDELEIIHYIGGSIVRKVRQRAIKMSNHDERRKVTEMVNDMASRDSTDLQQQDMIGILNRGGLSRPCPNMKYAFCAMEATFRRLFPMSSTTMKEDDFTRACLEDEQITCGYYESVCEVECDDRLKEKVLRIILSLFFKIRSHHNCRKIIDKLKHDKNVAGKAKSLRKTLKRRNDDVE